MAIQRVRRVPAIETTEASADWLDKMRWLDSQSINLAHSRMAAVLDAISCSASHWSWLTCVLGGTLWCVLLLLFQVRDYVFSWIGIGSYWIYFDLNRILLSLLLLFFLYGLIGLYDLTARRVSRAARIGFVLSVTGLVLAVSTVFDGTVLLLDPALDLARTSDLPGLYLLFDPGPLYYWRLSDWYYPIARGLLVFLVGLGMFGFAAVKGKAMPRWLATVLIAGTLTFYMPFLFDYLYRLHLITYESNEQMDGLLYEGKLFTALVTLFGISWIWLGFALFRKREQSLTTQR